MAAVENAASITHDCGCKHLFPLSLNCRLAQTKYSLRTVIIPCISPVGVTVTKEQCVLKMIIMTARLSKVALWRRRSSRPGSRSCGLCWLPCLVAEFTQIWRFSKNHRQYGKFTTPDEFDAFNDLFVAFINRGPRDLLTSCHTRQTRWLKVSPDHRGAGESTQTSRCHLFTAELSW